MEYRTFCRRKFDGKIREDLRAEETMGAMERSEKTSELKRPWVTSEKRRECLDLFEKGYGYKKAAREAGLNIYTVRDYRRRYAAGDTAWAYRFSNDIPG